MDEISHDDQCQLYLNNLVDYNGKLMLVRDIYDGIFTCRTAGNPAEVKDIRFEKDLFKAPRRIGYINTPEGALFLSRLPRRLYGIGLNRNNTEIIKNDVVMPKAYFEYIVSKEGIAEAYSNKYPTFYKAYQLAKEKQTTVAFDRQFAIDFQRNIYYKGSVTGVLPKGYVRKLNIQWFAGFEFCEYTLNANYEKTVRTFAN